MLDIPNARYLNKAALVGGCVRLSFAIDAPRLREEVLALPAEAWGDGGRVGVHRGAESLFLRGYAPSQGDLPVTDQPVLDLLPYTRWIAEKLFSADPLRCLLARLPAGAIIAPHVDRPAYFSKTLRVHIPVETNESVHMIANGLSYSMAAGEVWVLNNSSLHAVWNAHPTSARTHLICDYLPGLVLLDALAQGERDLGERRALVDQRMRVQAAAGG